MYLKDAIKELDNKKDGWNEYMLICCTGHITTITKLDINCYEYIIYSDYKRPILIASIDNKDLLKYNMNCWNIVKKTYKF